MTITDRESQAREISRSIGMVFQSFNLFPHMTALENVMLAPRRVLKKSAAECRELAQRMLEKVGLGDRLDYYPSSLSGGTAAARGDCPRAGDVAKSFTL